MKHGFAMMRLAGVWGGGGDGANHRSFTCNGKGTGTAALAVGLGVGAVVMVAVPASINHAASLHGQKQHRGRRRTECGGHGQSTIPKRLIRLSITIVSVVISHIRVRQQVYVICDVVVW